MTRAELNRLETEIDRARYRADAFRRIMLAMAVTFLICCMMAAVSAARAPCLPATSHSFHE